jgi:gas vesicle protein
MEENKGLSYFFLGLGIGVAVGMIFAPVSGTEARGAIRDRALEGGDYLKKRSQDLRDSANEVVQRGRDVVNRQRDQLSAAVDAGKQAYRETVGGAPAESAPSNPSPSPLGENL